LKEILVKGMLFQSVAVSFDVDNLAVMQQPVEDGSSNHRVSEEFLPISKILSQLQNSQISLILGSMACTGGCMPNDKFRRNVMEKISY